MTRGGDGDLPIRDRPLVNQPDNGCFMRYARPVTDPCEGPVEWKDRFGNQFCRAHRHLITDSRTATPTPDLPADLAPPIDRLRKRVEFLKGRNIFPTFNAADVAEALDVLAAQQADLARKQARITELTDGIRAHREGVGADQFASEHTTSFDATLWALLGEDPT